jgi:hypothetical protein
MSTLAGRPDRSYWRTPCELATSNPGGFELRRQLASGRPNDAFTLATGIALLTLVIRGSTPLGRIVNVGFDAVLCERVKLIDRPCEAASLIS